MLFLSFFKKISNFPKIISMVSPGIRTPRLRCEENAMVAFPSVDFAIYLKSQF